ncbi:hypothetical protein D3C81_1698920 [compost metagenome]
MRTHGLHDQVRYLAAGANPLVEQGVRQQVGLEVGAAVGGLPLAAGCTVAQVEAAWVAQALVEVGKACNGVADQVPDTVVVGHKPVPVDRVFAKCGSGDAGNHCRL